MYLTDSWYWNQDAERAPGARKVLRQDQAHALAVQAADYSAALHYLKAVKAAGSDDADKVMAQMKKTQDQRLFARAARSAPTAAWSTTCT